MGGLFDTSIPTRHTSDTSDTPHPRACVRAPTNRNHQCAKCNAVTSTRTQLQVYAICSTTSFVQCRSVFEVSLFFLEQQK